jgi:hypothetical protein
MKGGDIMGIASWVLGILALLTMWIPFVGVIALPMSIIGIILGVVAKKQLPAVGQSDSVATAGIAISIIAFIISALFTLACGACAICASRLI